MLFRSTLVFATLSALCCSAQDPKITMIPPSSSAQSSTKVDAEEQKKIVALWRDRAERFTAAAREDEWRIGVQRPVLEARLAQAWWKVDPLRAGSWLQGAVEEVTTDHRNEPDEIRDKRLQATLSVFRICVYLKQGKYVRKILDSLVAAAKDSGYDPKRHNSPVVANLTGSIMAAAIDIGREDPARAEDMATLLIQFHSGGYFNNVNGFIRVKDPQAADKLFSNALDTAADSRDYNMMYSLMQDAFPFFSNPGTYCFRRRERARHQQGGRHAEPAFRFRPGSPGFLPGGAADCQSFAALSGTFATRRSAIFDTKLPREVGRPGPRR